MAHTVTFKGQPMHLIGEQPNVGDKAPDVTLTKTDMQPLKLSDLRGKVVVLSVTPSLDTSVCQTMCRRFDHEAASLADDIVVVNVSVDTPFAINRQCTSDGLGKIIGASDYRDREFAKQYGLLIDELRLLARSVWVIDKQGTIVYKELVPEVAQEPNYDAALDAAKKAAGSA